VTSRPRNCDCCPCLPCAFPSSAWKQENPCHVLPSYPLSPPLHTSVHLIPPVGQELQGARLVCCSSEFVVRTPYSRKVDLPPRDPGYFLAAKTACGTVAKLRCTCAQNSSSFSHIDSYAHKKEGKRQKARQGNFAKYTCLQHMEGIETRANRESQERLLSVQTVTFVRKKAHRFFTTFLFEMIHKRRKGSTFAQG